MQRVLTVHLRHLRDVEPLTHPHDTHAIVEVKGITGKEVWGQAAGPVTWLPGDPMSSVGLWASVSLCVSYTGRTGESSVTLLGKPS